MALQHPDAFVRQVSVAILPESARAVAGDGSEESAKREGRKLARVEPRRVPPARRRRPYRRRPPAVCTSHRVHLGHAVPRRGDAHERRRGRVFSPGRIRRRRSDSRRVDRPRRLRVVDVHRHGGGFRGTRAAPGSPQAGDGILHARRRGRQPWVPRRGARLWVRVRRRFDHPRRFEAFDVFRRIRRPAGAQRVVLRPRRPQRLAQVPALLLQPVHVGSQPRVLRRREPPPRGELLEQVVDGW